MSLSSKVLYDQFVDDIELKWGSEESKKIAQKNAALKLIQNLGLK